MFLFRGGFFLFEIPRVGRVIPVKVDPKKKYTKGFKIVLYKKLESGIKFILPLINFSQEEMKKGN